MLYTNNTNYTRITCELYSLSRSEYIQNLHTNNYYSTHYTFTLNYTRTNYVRFTCVLRAFYVRIMCVLCVCYV